MCVYMHVLQVATHVQKQNTMLFNTSSEKLQLCLYKCVIVQVSLHASLLVGQASYNLTPLI